MKFEKFITAVIQNIRNKIKEIEEIKLLLNIKILILEELNNINTAVIKWAKYLQTLGSEKISSKKPTIAIGKQYKISWYFWNIANINIIITRKNPPTFGFGLICELRELATSSKKSGVYGKKSFKQSQFIENEKKV